MVRATKISSLSCPLSWKLHKRLPTLRGASATSDITTICYCTGNQDIESFFPFVVKASQTTTNTNEGVEKFAVCIFVQNVKSPALAAMLTILSRGLNDKVEAVRRTCCLIVGNICKFVVYFSRGDPVHAQVGAFCKTSL